MVKRLRFGILLTLAIIVPLALIFMACNEGTGTAMGNIRPTIQLTQSPLNEDTEKRQNYFQEFYWYGSDKDGYVSCYLYKIERQTNSGTEIPSEMYSQIPDAKKMSGAWANWVWTTSTCDTVYFTATDTSKSYTYRRQFVAIDNNAVWDYPRAASSGIDNEYFEDIGTIPLVYDEKDKVIATGDHEGIDTPLGQSLTILTNLEIRRALKPTSVPGSPTTGNSSSCYSLPAGDWFSIRNHAANLPYIDGVLFSNWDDAQVAPYQEGVKADSIRMAKYFPMGVDFTNIDYDTDSLTQKKTYKISWVGDPSGAAKSLLTYPSIKIKVTMNAQFGSYFNPENIKGFKASVLVANSDGSGWNKKLTIDRNAAVNDQTVYPTGEKGVAEVVVDLRDHDKTLASEFPYTAQDAQKAYTSVVIAIWSVDKSNALSEKCWVYFWDIMPVSSDDNTVFIHKDMYGGMNSFLPKYYFIERYVGGAPDNNPTAIRYKFKEFNTTRAIPRDLDCFSNIVWTSNDWLKANPADTHDMLASFEKYLTAYLDNATVTDRRNVFLSSLYAMSYIRAGALSSGFKAKYLHQGTYSYEFENGQFASSYDYTTQDLKPTNGNTNTARLLSLGDSRFPTLTVDYLHFKNDATRIGWVKEVVGYFLDTAGTSATALYKHSNATSTQGGNIPMTGFMEDTGKFKIVCVTTPLHPFVPQNMEKGSTHDRGDPTTYTASEKAESDLVRGIYDYVLRSYFK